MKLNTRLKEIREASGKTQVEVAQKARISVMSYYRYEQGKRVPDAQTASLIARAVGSTVESLWGGNPVRA